MHAEKDVFYCDLDLDPDVEYFLYVGELKADCLNPLLKDFLNRKFGKNFDFISVVPDVLASYPHGNMLVINPRSRQLAEEIGKKVCCRLPGDEFCRCVSESETVQQLVNKLLKQQARLFVHVYESRPELTLNRIPRVTMIGPDGEIARLWNNKQHQLLALQNTAVPIIDFRICRGYEEMLRTTQLLRSEWKHGIFVSQPYSAAGMNSFITLNDADIKCKPGLPDSQYIVSKYIPHISDPTVLGVVAGPENVFIAAVADQQIEGGNRFTGSVYPSALSSDIQNELKRHTRHVGRVLGQSGYRGVFGCDFIVDKDQGIHFVELNARKQGTTMEMSCTMEKMLPAGAPTLQELEFYAVTESRFPENTVEIQNTHSNICWQTYNFKTNRQVFVCTHISQTYDERELFRRVVCKELEHGMIIMEHVGQGLIADPGVFIGRIAAISRRRDRLETDILRGKELLMESISMEE